MTKILYCLLLLWSASSLDARSKHKNNPHAGTAGKFDYYVFSLSWSPEYCNDHTSATQCSVTKPFAFIVHGLWPEYTKGGYPSDCSRGPGLQNPSKMLDIMPDPKLIAHEWTKHGTCSGLDPEAYFGAIRKAYTAVKIPAKFQAPSQQFTTSPTEVAQQFSQANLKLPAISVAVSCPGNYLTEVQICLDKNLNATKCTRPSPCKASSIKVVPVK